MTNAWTMHDLRRTLDHAPLGTILSAAFAAALAFAIFAMPDWRLAQAVGATGLGAIISAAEPPLGGTARALLMILGAGAGGAAVYALFAWLERPHPGQDGEVEMLVLRRADAHPDAPVRRPIFAGADLGAPLDEAAIWLDAPEPRDAQAVAMDELLLDTPLEPAPPVVVQAVATPAVKPMWAPGEPAPSSAELIDRLEGRLRRRGTRAPRTAPAMLAELRAIHNRG